MQTSITDANHTDAETIARIISDSNKGVAQEFGITAENNAKHPSFCTKDWVLDDMGRGEEYFLMNLDDQAIGCIAFESKDTGASYLNRLAVLPEHRLTGVGQR